MFRSIFQPIAAAGALVALFSLNACQKDHDLSTVTDSPVNTGATQRNQVFYGVSVATPGQPSQLVQIDQNTGIVLGNQPINLDLGGGNTVPLNDVRGICYLGNGKYAITTSPSPVDFMANALLTLDVNTGLAYFLSSSNAPVTDIDYDPISGNIYGLSGNNLVTISGGGFNVYATVAIAGLPAGYTAKGLTMIGDVAQGNTQINIALTQNNNAGTTFVYKVSPAGASGFIAQLQPDNQLRGGNCGLSYQLTPGSEMYINRNTFTVFPGAGLNRLGGWPNQGVVATGVYGAAGWNLCDMSSDVGQ